MKKLLRISDKILLGLAFMGDMAIEVYTRGHGFGNKRPISDFFDIKKSTFRVEVNRFLKTGDIEKEVAKDGRVFLKLTSQGREKSKRLFPLEELSRKTWDFKWRFVIFDIEEESRSVRNLLRYKLVSLGFGKLQESIYISPLDLLVDVREFLKANGLYGRVLVFEARNVLGYPSIEMATKVWRLDRINEDYEQVIDEAESIKSEADQQKIKDLIDRYIQITLKDPFLPSELLPENWLRDKAKKEISMLLKLKSKI